MFSFNGINLEQIFERNFAHYIVKSVLYFAIFSGEFKKNDGP